MQVRKANREKGYLAVPVSEWILEAKTSSKICEDWTELIFSIDSNESTTLFCLDETSRVACNSGETQTREVLSFFGRDRLSGKILANVWEEKGNFEVRILKRCYIQIYLANFLLCYEKVLDLQNI